MRSRPCRHLLLGIQRPELWVRSLVCDSALRQPRNMRVGPVKETWGQEMTRERLRGQVQGVPGAHSKEALPWD